MLPIMQAADAAELRGDAAEALRIIAANLHGPDGEVFWRQERLRRLSQLVGLDGLLPRWATSRWVLAQAAQHLDESNRDRSGLAMHAALRVRGEPPGACPGDAHRALELDILDRDWAFRQIFLYELGGLAHFLQDVATPDLLAGADHIEEWAAAPLEAFRFRDASAGTLTWERLGTGETLETLDLGGATLLAPGDCALGRAVPTDEGMMFESAPLRVPEETAARVAEDGDHWVGAVTAACRLTDSAGKPACVTGGHDFALLTDVPVAVQLLLQLAVAGQKVGGPPGTPEEMAELEVQFVRAALAGHLDEREGISPWPTVAASLLENAVLSRILATLTPADRPRLSALAEKLAGPARHLCRWLTTELRESA